MQFARLPIHPQLGIIIIDAAELDFIEAGRPMPGFGAEVGDGFAAAVAGVIMVNPGRWAPAVECMAAGRPDFAANATPEHDNLADTIASFAQPLSCFETVAKPTDVHPTMITFVETRLGAPEAHGEFAYDIPFRAVAEVSAGWVFQPTRSRVQHFTPMLSEASPEDCLMNRRCLVCVGAYSPIDGEGDADWRQQVLADEDLQVKALQKINRSRYGSGARKRKDEARTEKLLLR